MEGPFTCYSTVPSEEGWQQAGRRQTVSLVVGLSWQDMKDSLSLGILKWTCGAFALLPFPSTCVLNNF